MTVEFLKEAARELTQAALGMQKRSLSSESDHGTTFTTWFEE